MNAREAVDRITVDLSPVSDTIRIGIANSAGTEFLEEKNCTNECIAAVAGLLLSVGKDYVIKGPTGKRYRVSVSEES